MQRVEFNARRVFSLPYLREVLSERFEIERLAFVSDAGDLIDQVDPFGAEADESSGADHGCSLGVLRKLAA
ncbi:MAG: hypothetical protein ACJAR2_000785 [Ilumatobacter sp.]